MTACPLCGNPAPTPTERNGLPLYECAACGLAFRRTFDLPDTYYEALDPASTADKRALRLRNARDRVRTFRRHMPLVGVCDIGTGDGVFLEALAEAGGTGMGIEPSVRAKEEAARHGVRIVGDRLEEVSALAGKEDVQAVTLFHVIEHLSDPFSALKLLYDALPPGGVLVIETPNFLSPLLRAKGYRDPLIYPEHLFYFSERTLPRALRQAGFEMLAQGRRDFDPQHLSISESLRRLSFLPWRASSPPAHAAPTHAPEERDEATAANGTGTPEGSFLRRALRAFLAHLVIAFGRQPYVWVMARKPYAVGSGEAR